MMDKNLYKLGLLCSIAMLTACGGDSNSDHTNVLPVEKDKINLSGTVFSESPLKQAQISAICNDNKGFNSSVITNDLGQWTTQIEQDRLPCKLQAKTQDFIYHSYIVKPQTHININPFTDLTIAIATQQLPSQWYQLGQNIEQTKLDLAIDTLNTKLKEKGYIASSINDYFYHATIVGDNIHQNIKDFSKSLASHAIIKDYNELLLLIKDGNLDYIPQRLTPEPTFNGKALNLNACDFNANFKTIYSNCSKDLIDDFLLSNLVDKVTGESCEFSKQGNNLRLTKGKSSGYEIITSLDKNSVLPNTLNLTQGYEISTTDMWSGTEFGNIIFRERSIKFNVSDKGKFIAVTGQTKNPDDEFTCQQKS